MQVSCLSIIGYNHLSVYYIKKMFDYNIRTNLQIIVTILIIKHRILRN